jgi:hypothetical protein
MAGRAIFALAAILGVAVLASCSGTNPRFGGEVDDPQPGYEQMVEDDYVEPDPPEPPAEYQQDAATWSCTLSVTYNEDWHDDILCRKGDEVQRPYLREWDDFVEEWEILESAREFEAQLNAGG